MNNGINKYQKYLSLSRLDNIVILSLVNEYGDEVLVATFVRVLIITKWLCFCCAQRESHKELPFFLYGESLGGAISLLIHLQQPNAWQGVILNGAMCGIGKFKPPWPAEHLLYLVAGLYPLCHFHAHNQSISLIF